MLCLDICIVVKNILLVRKAKRTYNSKLGSRMHFLLSITHNNNVVSANSHIYSFS